MTMGSGQAQPEKETWVRPHVDPPLTGGVIEVWCYVDQVAVKGRGLGSRVPSCRSSKFISMNMSLGMNLQRIQQITVFAM